MIYLKGTDNFSSIIPIIETFIKENSFNSYWREILEKAKDENNYSGDLYAIYNNKEIVGCVEIFMGTDLYISMIEVNNANTHFGSETIKSLFDIYDDIDTITGESLASAIEFWYKIGASFEEDEDEAMPLNELLDLGSSLSFTLERDNFLKYLKRGGIQYEQN